MPGGQYDSSKTRARPVFDQLWQQGRDWLPNLLALPRGGHPEARVRSGGLRLLEGHWEPNERRLDPPVSLLAWLIRHLGEIAGERQLPPGRRKTLAEGDPETVVQALEALRSNRAEREWWIFEGRTSPDVCLVAEEAIVVIEGKRTEAGATTHTEWLSGRHQMWRHIDAAWEIRGRRAVYGFLIVEGAAGAEPDTLPSAWREACETCCSRDALLSSFPHRSAQEADGISRCFLGATTWQAVCRRFGIDWNALPHTVLDSVAAPWPPLNRQRNSEASGKTSTTRG